MQMKKFNNKIEIYLELSEIAEMLKEWKKYTIKTSSKLLQRGWEKINFLS